LKFSEKAEEKYDEPGVHGPKDPDISNIVNFDVLTLNKFRGHFSSEARRHRIPTLIAYFCIITHAQWP